MTEVWNPHRIELANISNQNYKSKPPVEKKFEKFIPEIKNIMRDFFSQYSKNFDYYINITGRKCYTDVCDQIRSNAMYAAITAYNKNIKNVLNIAHPAQAAYISKLPMGVWMAADFEYLQTNLIIHIQHKNPEISIGAPYFTDGFFFYSKHMEQCVPIGSPKIQKHIDEIFDPRKYVMK